MNRILAKSFFRQCNRPSVLGIAALVTPLYLCPSAAWCNVNSTAGKVSEDTSASFSPGTATDDAFGDFLISADPLYPPLTDSASDDSDLNGVPGIFPHWLPMADWVNKGIDTTRKITDALLSAWHPVSYLDSDILPAAYQNTDFSGFYQPLDDSETGFYLSADFEEPWQPEREFCGDILSLEGAAGFTYALDSDVSLRWGINGRLLNDQQEGHDWDLDLHSSLGITYQF